MSEIRSWKFRVCDFEDVEYYVDEAGRVIGRHEAEVFRGPPAEAAKEADRRARLWEKKNDQLAATAVYEVALHD